MNGSTSTYRFDTPEPVDLRVELGTGQVTVDSAETAETTVELAPVHGDSYAKELIADARVEQTGNRISVTLPKNKSNFFGRKGQVRVTVVVPHESGLRIETGSADVEARGRYGAAQVKSGSGDIDLDEIRSGDLSSGSGDVKVATASDALKVKTGSGDVTLGPVGGSCDVATGSGDLVMERVQGDLKAKTGSGDIVLETGGDRVNVMAGSGDLHLKCVDHGEVVAKTGSGDVTVGIAYGTAAYLDIQTVTGDVRSALDSLDAPTDGDPTVSVSVMSGTGDVVLQRA